MFAKKWTNAQEIKIVVSIATPTCVSCLAFFLSKDMCFNYFMSAKKRI